jgi:hypothetical protein
MNRARRGPWGEHEKFDLRHRVRGEPGKYRECDGAGLSVSSHHDRRAVRGGRGDGYDRARDGRANEKFAWSTRHCGGRDWRGRYHRGRPGRTRGTRRLFPRDRQPPEALGAFQKAEIEKWWPIIKAANIKGE